ncbi:MAG: alpha/beta hydrolase [Nocardioides sp.]
MKDPTGVAPLHRLVQHGAVRLATTDHGGGVARDRPDLVLMPGLGLTRGSLDRLIERLSGWRVITMDLRGHGASTTAPWSFEAAVDDLHHVVLDYGLERPFIGGHSLGGMIALRYALAGHQSEGAINIDGWGPGIASRFVGADPAVVDLRLDELADGVLPSRLGTWISARTRAGREGTMLAVMRELRRADIVAWHAEAPVPSLALHAVAPPARSVGWMLGREMVHLQRAHHAGLSRDLAAVAAQRTDVSVVEVDATHALFRTHPHEVAAAIDDFWLRRR